MRIRYVQVTKLDCPRKPEMLRCTFKNVSCTASSASMGLPRRLRATFFMRAPCSEYRRSYPPKSPVRQRSASSASSEVATVIAAGAAVSLGRPVRFSEGSTRFSRSRGTEEILVSQGSASPIVPISCSWDIDDYRTQNVRGAGRRMATADLAVRRERIDSTGDTWRGVEAEINLPMQQAVFVPDDEKRLGVVLGDQQAQSGCLLGHVEDKLFREGLAGT